MTRSVSPEQCSGFLRPFEVCQDQALGVAPPRRGQSSRSGIRLSGHCTPVQQHTVAVLLVHGVLTGVEPFAHIAHGRAAPENRQHNSNDIPAASDRPIAMPRLRAPKVTAPDIYRVRKGSRHFCAAGTFCASFRHVRAARDTRSPRTYRLYARQNNVVRNLSHVLIAAEIEARAEGSTARMPYASPYCP